MRKGRNGFQQASATVRAKSARNGVTHSRLPADSGQPKRSAASRNGNELDLARLHALPVNRIRGRFPRWKRTLDIIFVLVTLPFWLPLMAVVMGVIRLNSRGPVFYRQRRIGYRGKQFMLFKFRTMYVNAETRSHEDYFASLVRAEVPMIKLDAAGDPRLIPWARFLRASGLDELPQIFNVLRGDMSLVGPRPCLPSEFNRYEVWQQGRVNAPPGLTGYWQVNGKNKTTFNQMVFMDLFYVDKMSIWFDLAIISKTIPVLISESIEALERYRSRRLSRSVDGIPQAMAVIPTRDGAHPSGNGSHYK
jgi:lipopolysaccharide/colanic/teichoic acid biosynthesis glycosyltransferase